jgi:ubiquinone/menaquinone biosynthesis C-methylase UbiE
MSAGGRVTDYDRIADRYDTRYRVCSYDGVRDTLVNFIGPEAKAVLEVGCGTGHWLRLRSEESRASFGETGRTVVGIDLSAAMLSRARAKAPSARLMRGRAESLPFRDASFDRVYCVNALHHFSDRAAFFAEARRVLKPGGGVLTIAKDPHTENDDWWVYTYFEPTRAIDRERYARVRTLRGELALAGFAWTESMEADHIESVRPASEALAMGVIDPSFTSQLTVLSDEEYAAGVEKLRQANEAAGGELQLVADFRLYATIGWRS